MEIPVLSSLIRVDEAGRGPAPQRWRGADQMCSWTEKPLWFIPAHTIPYSQVHQMQLRLPDWSPKSHNCPAFPRCVISDIHRCIRWTIPTYFSTHKSSDSARSCRLGRNFTLCKSRAHAAVSWLLTTSTGHLWVWYWNVQTLQTAQVLCPNET